MKLTESKVKYLYNKFLTKATGLFEKGCYSNCMTFLKAAGHTGYFFYLGYKDDKVESLLYKLSGKLKQTKEYSSTVTNRFVFYDSFSIDNGGLVQQYLTAVMYGGFDITYITERRNFLERKSAIRSLLDEYGKASVIVVPSEYGNIEKAQFVYDSIIQTKTDKLLIHSGPSSVFANVAFYALPCSITRYKINLTDHTFWIGAGCFDYSFEFRPYGCSLSAHERGILDDKLLYLPFYPIMNRTHFNGYPKEANDKVVLLSGGAYYKIYDESDTYFKMTKSILDSCPNVVLLFAGDGDKLKLQNKIAEYGMQDRFLLIGQRSDITEVFDHCDIYLNTYPFGGGLMSQYAAQLAKPIVNYFTPETAKVEEFVCQRNQIELSDSTIENLTKRVKRLSESENARISLGREIQNCVITPDVFNETFKRCIQTGNNQIPYFDDPSAKMRSMDIKDKLKYESESKEYARAISKIFGLSSIFIEPSLFLDAFRVLIKGNRVVKAMKNNIN